MIGCIPAPATSRPFQIPRATQTASASSTASTTAPLSFWFVRWLMFRQATAPEMATRAPTERSMPPVAMTSVIPRATSSSGEPRRRMSIRLP